MSQFLDVMSCWSESLLVLKISVNTVYKRIHDFVGIQTTFFFFKQKTAYDVRQHDWSSDVCSSDLQWTTGDQQIVRKWVKGKGVQWPSMGQVSHAPSNEWLAAPVSSFTLLPTHPHIHHHTTLSTYTIHTPCLRTQSLTLKRNAMTVAICSDPEIKYCKSHDNCKRGMGCKLE